MATTNVQMEREGDVLTIRIDLAQEHGLSKSQATVKIASTGGFAPVPGPDGTGQDEKITLNLNCNKQRD